MRNIFVFLLRFHFFILFVILQIIAFSFFLKSTNYQRAKLTSFGNEVAGRVYEKTNAVYRYFDLENANRKLATENTRLQNTLDSLYSKKIDTTRYLWRVDTSRHYRYTVAQVIHNSINRRSNFIMLNKGSKDGLRKDMAVITSTGVVGIVENVSEHFAWVMSILNKNTRISGRITSNNQMGTIVWNGFNPRMGDLVDVPPHIKIAKSDTVVTSGFSFIFPPGILVGFIENFEAEEHEHFSTIPFRFSVDYNSLNYVYVIENLYQQEQKQLEQPILEEDTKNE